ncbi:hypothetical protein [Lysinibacillus sp. NPDC092081]|uniref:hypothetical protein n=1 Tax=Lysinibacillus sp. NPDC092081 TaxID=3364131 RepID=UPI00382FD970
MFIEKSRGIGTNKPLGGGSIVRVNNEKITVGPDGVGYKIAEEALVFGGNTLTTTDIAVRLGLADVGDRRLVCRYFLFTLLVGMEINPLIMPTNKRKTDVDKIQKLGDKTQKLIDKTKKCSDKIKKLDDILLKCQNHLQIAEDTFFINLNFIAK